MSPRHTAPALQAGRPRRDLAERVRPALPPHTCSWPAGPPRSRCSRPTPWSAASRGPPSTRAFVRHRRPSVLHRDLHPAVQALWEECSATSSSRSPALPDPLRRQVLRLPAQGGERAARASARRQRGADPAELPEVAESGRPGRGELRAVGVQPLRPPCMRSSSRPIPRKSGAFRAPRSGAEWAAQRIQGLSLARAILSGRAQPSLGHDQESHQRVQVSSLGPGQMWEACRDRVIERGGRVLLNVSGHPSRSRRWPRAGSVGDNAES